MLFACEQLQQLNVSVDLPSLCKSSAIAYCFISGGA